MAKQRKYRHFGKLYLLDETFKRKSEADSTAKYLKRDKTHLVRVAQLPKAEVFFGRKWGVYRRDNIRAPRGMHWTHSTVWPGPGNERPEMYLDEQRDLKRARQMAKLRPKVKKPARAKQGRVKHRPAAKRSRVFGFTTYHVFKVFRTKSGAKNTSDALHRGGIHARVTREGPRRYIVWCDEEPHVSQAVAIKFLRQKTRKALGV